MFFTGNLFHTAGKEILVGISVDIFNRSFLILYNKQTKIRQKCNPFVAVYSNPLA